MERNNYWTERLSRRRLIAASGAAGTGLAGLVITGCGDDDGDDDEPSGSASATPRASVVADPNAVNKDGILKLRQTAPFASINPYKGLDSGLLWGFTIFDHLFYTPYDTGVRELFLATSVEQPDSLTINIKIGESLFHNKPPANGRAVKAGDIKASLESAAKQTRISNSSWWTQVLESVQATDDKTLVVKLKAVDAWTFTSTNFGSPIASSILPEEVAKAPDSMDQNLVGSGRFEFVSHENGTNFKLKRFDNWRIKGEPWLAGVNYKLIQEQALALTAFSSKEIDQVLPNSKLEREQLVQKHGKDIEFESEVTRSVWTILHRADGQWKNPKIAQAISLALDKKEFIQLMNIGDGVPSGPVPSPFKSQALTETELNNTFGKFDAIEARKLIEASGLDLSKEYTIKYYIPGERPAQFAQIVRTQLNKNLGMNVRISGEDFGNWLAQSLYGGNFDFITFPSLTYDDPSSYLGAYTKIVGGRPNYMHYEDDELDALVIKQKTILNDEERNKAVHDLQLKAWEKGAPVIPVFTAITGNVTWAHYKGRILGRGSYGLFNGRAYIDKK